MLKDPRGASFWWFQFLQCGVRSNFYQRFLFNNQQLFLCRRCYCFTAIFFDKQFSTSWRFVSIWLDCVITGEEKALYFYNQLLFPHNHLIFFQFWRTDGCGRSGLPARRRWLTFPLIRNINWYTKLKSLSRKKLKILVAAMPSVISLLSIRRQH